MSDELGGEQEHGGVNVTAPHVNLRLNSVPGPLAPGGNQDFASTPAEKKAAANTIETELQPNTQKASDHADEATKSAGNGFGGWETAAGIKTVAETWDRQVKSLMARLDGEKSALRGASGLFVRNDTGLGADFRASASKLNGL
ncbi:hypothetical protein ABT144_25795 [Streptomyces sp. NPDC002039]|uniref:hypothetical protein n=1 Tax=unclassified Streptomyces TaxID=2593676 RepID=UPI0033347F4F